MGHRTDVPMTGPSNFNELVPPFLHYKNVSKIFYELLRPIPTHAERPQDFKKNVIALIKMAHNIFGTFLFKRSVLDVMHKFGALKCTAQK